MLLNLRLGETLDLNCDLLVCKVQKMISLRESILAKFCGMHPLLAGTFKCIASKRRSEKKLHRVDASLSLGNIQRAVVRKRGEQCNSIRFPYVDIIQCGGCLFKFIRRNINSLRILELLLEHFQLTQRNHNSICHFRCANMGYVRRFKTSLASAVCGEPNSGSNSANRADCAHPIRTFGYAYLCPGDRIASEIYDLYDNRDDAYHCNQPPTPVQRLGRLNQWLPIYKLFFYHFFSGFDWQNRNTRSVGGGK